MKAHPYSAVTPTAILREERETILRALALLERLGENLEAGKPVDREALGWLMQFFRTFADRRHRGKEEQHLFPALERRGVPREGEPLGVMREEHEEGRALVRAMAAGDDTVASAMFRIGLLTPGGVGRQPRARVRPGAGPAEKGPQ
ncbi:MAG: hemerythrin domain-containing protein [Candidatus Methylomirabilia bacterium]